MRLARRGPETVVSSVTGAKVVSHAPSATPVVRSAPIADAVKSPPTLARLLKELYTELDHIRTQNATVLSGAVFLQDMSLPSGTTYLEHKLGRVPRGVMATLATSTPVFRVALTAAYDPTRHIGVATTTAQTVSLLVF